MGINGSGAALDVDPQRNVGVRVRVEQAAQWQMHAGDQIGLEANVAGRGAVGPHAAWRLDRQAGARQATEHIDHGVAARHTADSNRVAPIRSQVDVQRRAAAVGCIGRELHRQRQRHAHIDLWPAADHADAHHGRPGVRPGDQRHGRGHAAQRQAELHAGGSGAGRAAQRQRCVLQMTEAPGDIVELGGAADVQLPAGQP